MENTENILNSKTKRARKLVVGILGALFILATTVIVAFKVSPWPSALLIRYAFNKEAIKVNHALASHVPAGVSEFLNLPYDTEDDDAKLDLFFPAGISKEYPLPLIVWIHGGGLISGDKSQVGNYCRILASKGFVVASIDYSIAPEGKYPKPVKQANSALGYLNSYANRFYIDSNNIFLAGDSGGSHIAAQLANVVYDSGYAEMLDIQPSIVRQQLSGLVLYCGIYDISNISFEGSFGSFFRTVLWSYGGVKDVRNSPLIKSGSILNHVSTGYPACFISAGNADPLLNQSKAFSRKLSSLHVKVDTVFYSAQFEPRLPHEYQFNLDTDAGKRVLEASVAFIRNAVLNKRVLK